MEIGAFYLPSVGRMADIKQGMAGKRTDLYQMMLRELTEQLQYMDQNGYYGCGFTEHHFHIEGEEVSTNPVILDLYFGMQTQRMKFGQLGNVLPSQNPINLAENIAMVSQMLQGRVFAGFARGYQPRWVNVIGQRFEALRRNAGEAEAAYEAAKRDLYEEHFEIIMKAWQNDTFSHQGKYWQIPPAEDIYWPAVEVSKEFGGGIDDNGMVREIGIAPKTYNKRIPDLFQPFSFSERTIRWAMRHDVSPISIIAGDLEAAKAQFRAAQEERAACGKEDRFGANMGITREIVCADTDEEARRIALDAGAFLWCKFFQPFGFNAAIALPGEDPMTVQNDFESLEKRGLVICGSPDTVTRKLEALFQELPADYFWMMQYNELVPQPAMMRHLELMTTKVWPRFTDKIRG